MIDRVFCKSVSGMYLNLQSFMLNFITQNHKLGHFKIGDKHVAYFLYILNGLYTGGPSVIQITQNKPCLAENVHNGSSLQGLYWGKSLIHLLYRECKATQTGFVNRFRF